MEIFVDGGMFEVAIALVFGYAINFIFVKKYLLILFSVTAVVAPAALLFSRDEELRYWLESICLLNAILLVVLLWRQRLSFPEQPLFNTEKFKQRFLSNKKRSQSMYPKDPPEKSELE